MPGDYTRFTFSPVRDYVTVLMQQGRVQLDADWNEFADILDRRWRAETIDVMGRAVVPRETPEAFHITMVNGKLMIGAGRMYVDGVLAENHGDKPAGFDPILAEPAAGQATRFDDQLYMPAGTPQVPQPPYLIYLDVWEREVTVTEEPLLIEKAVGVDTTTRRQAAWQVKTLAGVSSCPAANQNVAEWTKTVASSPARLTASTVQGDTPKDPCLIPPQAGYRGMENQFYRVEIHDAGKAGHATFKWSRDNASAAAGVSNIRAGANTSDLILSTAGRDPSLAFNVDDWIEITDDWLELSGQPGFMFRVSKVDDALRTVTVKGNVPALSFPTTGTDTHTDPERHTRIRRWDQKGPVYDGTGNKIADDLDASHGAIPVPATKTGVILESGIQVTFSTDPVDGEFRVGDHWVFAARTADGGIEPLADAPPRGVHHHYCPLAVVPAGGGAPEDCRTFWPPASAAGCGCTICVTAESHNSGQLTIQYAIDQVKAEGGVVCLGPGFYNVRNQVNLAGCNSVRLTGSGGATILAYGGGNAAINVQKSNDVVVENLTVLAFGGTVESGTYAPSSAIVLNGCMGAVVRECVLLQVGLLRDTTAAALKPNVLAAAISIGSWLVGLEITHNLIYSFGTGLGVGRNIRPLAVTTTAETVSTGEGTNAAAFTLACEVSENLFWCKQEGIDLTGRLTFHTGPTTFRHNAILGCERFGIAANGTVVNGTLTVAANIVRVPGAGIAVGCDDAFVDGNSVGPMAPGTGKAGIMIGPPAVPNALDRVRIVRNTVVGMGGDGIVVNEGTRLASAIIRENVIQGVQGGGIVCEAGVTANSLDISSNELLDVGAQSNDKAQPIRGISIASAQHISISGNSILRLGAQAVQSPSRTAIEVLGETVTIAGNSIIGVGPREYVQESVAIRLLTPFDRAQIRDNNIRQSQLENDKPVPANWCAIRVGSTALSIDKAVITADFRKTVAERRRTRSSTIARPPTVSFAHMNIAAANPHPVMVEIGQNIASINIAGMLRLDPATTLAIRGNAIECSATVAPIEVRSRGALNFGDNQCRQAERTPKPVVSLTADTMIVTSNCVFAPGELGMDLHPSSEQAIIVLGNISSSGSILVNSKNLKTMNLPANISA